MRFVSCALALSLSLLFPLLVPAAPLQDLNPKQQAVVKEYDALHELQDLRGINRLVVRDPKSIDEILTQYGVKYSIDGDVQILERLTPMAAALDEVEQGKRVAMRFERFRTMDPGGRRMWLAAWNAWVEAANKFADANNKRERADLTTAQSLLKDAVAAAEKAGDGELASYARYHVGYTHELLGEYSDAVLVWEKTIDEWNAAGRPKDPMYEYMVNKRRELMEKNPTPGQPGEMGAGGAKKNSTTSYKEGSAWKDSETTYREMKDPAQVASVSPWGCENVLLWREFGWGDNDRPRDFGILVQAAPFGKPLKLFRQGAKGFFDVDGDLKVGKGDPQVKVIDGKPSLNSIAMGDGKEAERYAFFMLSGGQGQTWFQTTVNFQQNGYYRIGCYRETKVGDETVLLVDDNCSGTIGDPSDQGDNIWRGNPRWIDNDGIVIGKGKPQPWSDIVLLGGKWHHLKAVDPHAKRIRTRELVLETGNVVLKWNGPVAPKMLVVAEIGDMKGSYFDVAGGAPVNLPAGRYEIAYGRIETGKGTQMKQAWLFKGDAPEFEVKAGETTTLDMGGPYVVDFKTDLRDKSLVVVGKSMIVREKTGAILGRIYDEIPYCEVSYRKKGGTPIGKPKAMSKITTEIFNTDSAAQWFPGDFAIENVKTEDGVEVQLNLKKHALLGGPFTSEWR